jgi:hypothetical protein
MVPVATFSENPCVAAVYDGGIGYKLSRVSWDGYELVFSLSGIDFEFAKALRSVLYSYTPTVRVEEVKVLLNTSRMDNFELASRIGLVKFAVDPAALAYRQFSEGATNVPTYFSDVDPLRDYSTPCRNVSELDTIELVLDASCAAAAAGDRAERPETLTVVPSKHIKWEPKHDQARKLSGMDPLHGVADVPIVELLPGQAVRCVCYMRKGIGRMHAKWSAVTRAWYHERIVPRVVVPTPKASAVAIASRCSKGVFGVAEPLRSGEGASDHHGTAATPSAQRLVLLDELACDACLNCVRTRSNDEMDVETCGVNISFDDSQFVFHVESDDPAVLPGDAVEYAFRELLGPDYAERNRVFRTRSGARSGMFGLAEASRVAGGIAIDDDGAADAGDCRDARAIGIAQAIQDAVLTQLEAESERSSSEQECDRRPPATVRELVCRRARAQKYRPLCRKHAMDMQGRH